MKRRVPPRSNPRSNPLSPSFRDNVASPTSGRLDELSSDVLRSTILPYLTLANTAGLRQTRKRYQTERPRYAAHSPTAIESECEWLTKNGNECWTGRPELEGCKGWCAGQDIKWAWAGPPGRMVVFSRGPDDYHLASFRKYEIRGTGVIDPPYQQDLKEQLQKLLLGQGWWTFEGGGFWGRPLDEEGTRSLGAILGPHVTKTTRREGL